MTPIVAKGLARTKSRLIGQAESIGIDRQELLKAAGLKEIDLGDPDARIPVIKRWRLWSHIMEEDPNPDLGLEFGSAVGVRDMGLLGYTLLHSRTLLQSLRRLVRYGRLLSDFAIALTLERVDRGWRLTNPGVPAFLRTVRQPADEGLAVLLSVVREITDEKVIPVRVEFPYERPASTEALSHFYQTDLRFAAACQAMTFRGQDMELPLVDSDEQLTSYLEELAEEKLDALTREDSFGGLVRRAIWSQLSDGQPTVPQVAAELNVSPRTLQRRLRQEGGSFSELVDALRREMAPILLRDREMAVYEVAYLLGYGEPSTFFRAFRRWHGRSPCEYRQHVLN